MRKPRVLLLLHSLSRSGAQKVAVDTFCNFKDEVELRTISIEGGPLEKDCQELGSLTVLRTPSSQKKIGRLKSKLMRPIRSVSLERWQPDLIYINSVAALPIFEALQIPQAPALLHVHEASVVLGYWAQKYGKLISTMPRKYIAVSEAVKQALISGFDISPEAISVIYPFVNDVDPIILSSASSIKQDPRFVVGGCGYPSWIKGGVLWLQAADKIRSRIGEDKMRFLWVGLTNDDCSWQFRQIAKKLELESMVEMIPSTPDVYKYFSQFDVFALTSWEDSCPLVVMESMMMGKPAICFAGSGGAKEEVGNTGIVIEGYSPSAMADAIIELWQSPDRRVSMGAAARDRALNNFTASSQAPLIYKEVMQLIETHRR